MLYNCSLFFLNLNNLDNNSRSFMIKYLMEIKDGVKAFYHIQIHINLKKNES